jgi:hypothetical protein
VPPVAAKRIRGVVAAAERAQHQVRRADRPRSGRPPRGDWYAVAPLPLERCLGVTPRADKTSVSPCLSVRVRTTSVFFFGIRPSFGTITQLASALLRLGVGAQWHHNFTGDGIPESESSTPALRTRSGLRRAMRSAEFDESGRVGFEELDGSRDHRSSLDTWIG